MPMAALNSRITFNDALHSSTSALSETIRASPFSGFILLPLKAIAFGAKFKLPATAACVKIRITIIGKPTTAAVIRIILMTSVIRWPINTSRSAPCSSMNRALQ